MDERYAVVALSPLRKVIAARMTEAKRTIPHFRISVEMEVDALLDVRHRLCSQAHEVNPSFNDLLIKACARALMDVPAVNAQWVDGNIHQYRAADISVVTAVDGGLATPIVCDAESKTIWQIAREVRELTGRAKRNALRMDEILGGSFSVSNLGMYEVDHFDAIINAPQCAILAVGQAKPRCLVSANREMRISTVLHATLSVDHRVLDGAVAAAFLGALRTRVEQPLHLIPEGVE